MCNHSPVYFGCQEWVELHLHALTFLSEVVRGGRTTLMELVLRLDYGMSGLVFESRRGPKICVFLKSSTPVFGPMHPHTQWVPALFRGGKSAGTGGWKIASIYRRG